MPIVNIYFVVTAMLHYCDRSVKLFVYIFSRHSKPIILKFTAQVAVIACRYNLQILLICTLISISDLEKHQRVPSHLKYTKDSEVRAKVFIIHDLDGPNTDSRYCLTRRRGHLAYHAQVHRLPRRLAPVHHDHGRFGRRVAAGEAANLAGFRGGAPDREQVSGHQVAPVDHLVLDGGIIVVGPVPGLAINVE